MTGTPRKLWKDVQTFLGVRELPSEELDIGVVNSAKDVGPDLEPPKFCAVGEGERGWTDPKHHQIGNRRAERQAEILRLVS